MSHDQSIQSPFRKVSIGTWADRKVMSLSPMAPSGQALFVMLMIGPQTTNIPGVQPIGRMGFAEMLEWDQEGFDEAFAEVFREGLAKADWKARLVFVPKAIQHNLPQSPNVVKSWANTWARVPDCDLKTEAWHTIFEALTGLGESYARAFIAACPLGSEATDKGSGKTTGKPSVKASDKPTGKPTDNQEAVISKQEEVIESGSNATTVARAGIPGAGAPPPPGRTQIDPDFVADESNRRTAHGLGLDVEAERERFVAHFTATGDWRANWQSQFRKWLLDSMQHKADRGRRAGSKPNPGQRTADAAQRWLDSQHEAEGTAR